MEEKSDKEKPRRGVHSGYRLATGCLPQAVSCSEGLLQGPKGEAVTQHLGLTSKAGKGSPFLGSKVPLSRKKSQLVAQAYLAGLLFGGEETPNLRKKKAGKDGSPTEGSLQS